MVYGYRSDGYQLIPGAGGYNADRLHPGDIIEMIMNKNDKTMYFCVNNKKQQKWCTIRNACKYWKMAVETSC